jgi:hypothetical protein
MESNPQHKTLTRLPVDPTLAESLRQGEASNKLEGIDVLDNPLYVDVKRRLLAGEISLEEAQAIFVDHYTKDNTLASVIPGAPLPRAKKLSK